MSPLYLQTIGLVPTIAGEKIATSAINITYPSASNDNR